MRSTICPYTIILQNGICLVIYTTTLYQDFKAVLITYFLLSIKSSSTASFLCHDYVYHVYCLLKLIFIKSSWYQSLCSMFDCSISFRINNLIFSSHLLYSYRRSVLEFSDLFFSFSQICSLISKNPFFLISLF